ncbi:unnamed protein product, partial [marine sediment metagenome]
MADKEIDDLTAYTTQPADTDVFVFKRVTAAVTRSITYLNLVKDWWETKTAAYTAVKNDRLLVNTTSVAITIKLPAAPVAGDTIRIADSHGKWNTNNVTVDRNGKKIRAAT